FCAFFVQAEDGIRDRNVTGVQTCALPILGPVVATALLLLWDLQGLLVLILPSLIMSLVIWKVTSKDTNKKVLASNTSQKEDLPKDQWKPFSILSVVLIMRSIVFISLNTFFPFFWFTVFLYSIDSGIIFLVFFGSKR